MIESDLQQLRGLGELFAYLLEAYDGVKELLQAETLAQLESECKRAHDELKTDTDSLADKANALREGIEGADSELGRALAGLRDMADTQTSLVNSDDLCQTDAQLHKPLTGSIELVSAQKNLVHKNTSSLKDPRSLRPGLQQKLGDLRNTSNQLIAKYRGRLVNLLSREKFAFKNKLVLERLYLMQLKQEQKKWDPKGDWTRDELTVAQSLLKANHATENTLEKAWDANTQILDNPKSTLEKYSTAFCGMVRVLF